MIQRQFTLTAIGCILASFLCGASSLNSMNPDQPDSCGIYWNATQQITNDSSFNVVPQIVVSGDSIHLLWFSDRLSGGPTVQDSELGIRYSRSFDGGKSFTRPLQLESWTEANGGRGILSVSETHLYLMYSSRVDSPLSNWIGFRMSEDAGSTWQGNRRLIEGRPISIASHDSSVFILFGFIDSFSLYSIGCLASHDFGATFNVVSQRILPVGTNSATRISNLVSTSSGLHFVFQEGFFSYSEIVYCASDEMGETWSAPVIISTLDSMSSVAPEIKGDDSGNVYVIWYDGKYGSIDGFHGSVQFRASTDNGKTWKPETTLSYSPTALQPSMAVEENKIGIMWEEYVDTYEDRILARWSHDHGTTWCDTTEVIANGGDVACGIGKDGLFGTWFSRTTGAQIYLRDGVFPSEPPRNIPSNIELFQNYPNPFNGGTNITFDITMEVTGTITIKIFNILGQVVSVELLQTEANKYHYEHKWNAEGYPSGTYFYTINIGEKWIGRKMMLVR